MNQHYRCFCSECEKDRIRSCETCGREFRAWKSTVERGGGRFCSIQCNTRIGEKNPNWRGGTGVDSRGAKWVTIPGTSIRVNEYRLIAEEKIGRPLTDDEIVHHIDGDVTNDHPDNLQVMTQSEHCSIHTTELHAAGRMSVYEEDAQRGLDGRFLSKEERCV